MPGGRPSKLTPEIQSRICAVLRAGNYREVACAKAGVHYATFARWMADGKAATAGPFREFHDAVKRAEAYAEAKLLGQIRTASVENWQAAAWMLERKTPDRWGRRDKVTLDLAVQRELEQALEKLSSALDRETYGRVLGVLAGSEGGADAAGAPADGERLSTDD